MVNYALEITEDEALVLFEFFSRFDDTGQLQFEHAAECLALQRVAAQIDKTTSAIFSPDYHARLAEARARVADVSAEIPMVTWHEAVRRRPTMFIGDTGHFGLLHLLRDLMGVPLNPTKLSLVLDGAAFRIEASSVAPSVEPREPHGQPFLIEACTNLMLPLDRPATLAGVEDLDESSTHAVFRRTPVAPSCLAIANALSESFEVSSTSRGAVWRAGFARGVLCVPLANLRSSDPDGLRIAFTPDAAIFGDATPRFDLLAHLAREVSLVRQIPVELRDERSGRVFAACIGVG